VSGPQIIADKRTHRPLVTPHAPQVVAQTVDSELKAAAIAAHARHKTQHSIKKTKQDCLAQLFQISPVVPC